MASLAAIRDAIKSRLATAYAAENIMVYDTVPGDIAAPAVIVEPDSGEYHQTLGSVDQTMHQFAVHAFVALGDRAAAQDDLDSLISNTGARSIKAAIEGDRTLGGVVKWCDPIRYRDYGTRRYGDADYLGATIDVQCLSS